MSGRGQGNLFDVALNSTVHPDAVARLSRQSKAIITRLRAGTATNAELAQIGIRYSARIGELRAAGYRIDIVSRDHAGGLNVYQLTEDDDEPQQE